MLTDLSRFHALTTVTTAARFLRFRDAPRYLGMDKNRFNREVRPYVIAIRIGTHGIAFDRLDLDAWADDYKSRNGRPAAERNRPWDERSTPASCNVARSGTSTRSSEDVEFAKALYMEIGRASCRERV